jgi:MFS transporter, PAT family, beta-lactamase induction signal transducer AmpG
MSTVAGQTSPPRVGGSMLAALAGRRPLAMLALGFSAGLPPVLVFDVLSLWMRASGVSLEAIGFFSLVGLTYSLKFLWSPLLDRVELPVLTTRLGRRRSWMLACQLLIMLGLWTMSAVYPAGGLGILAVLALTVALLSATQDIAIDAWRIEASSAAAGLGIMAAAYQWGYRVAVLVGGAVPLMLAEPFGWNVSYAATAALAGIGIAATLAAPREELHHAAVPRRAGIVAAFGEPLRDFLGRHGSSAVLMLALVCTYRLPDLVRSIMGPFYLDLGFTLTEIAQIRRVFGMVMTMAGVAAGSFVVVRFGLARAMVAGAVFATCSSLAFGWLATQGRDLPALVAATGLEHAAAGFAGTCLIAYTSSLTSSGFAATQYALLSSIFSLPGRLLASQSGRIVEGVARAAQADGPLSAVGPLFAGLPIESYATSANPVALGAGYLAFFSYSAALGAAVTVLAVSVALRADSQER